MPFWTIQNMTQKFNVNALYVCTKHRERRNTAHHLMTCDLPYYFKWLHTIYSPALEPLPTKLIAKLVSRYLC